MVAVEDTIVQMLIGCSAEGLIVEAGQTQALFQILFKIVQRPQVRGLCRFFPSAGRLEKLLIPSIHENADLIADHDARLSYLRMRPACILQNGATVAFGDPGAATGGLRAKSGLLQ